MKGKVKKESSRISGVKCVVDSCYYNGEGDCCMASMIEIRPKGAGTSNQTDCGTFAPK